MVRFFPHFFLKKYLSGNNVITLIEIKPSIVNGINVVESMYINEDININDIRQLYIYSIT